MDYSNLDTLYNVFYKVDSFTTRIDRYVKDIIRAKIPLLTLDELFLDTASIKEDMYDRMKEVMAVFGYRLLDTLLVDIEPNKMVAGAMISKVKMSGSGNL